MFINESTLIENYSNRLSAGQAALFIGAGMSVQSGIVDWKKLLSQPAEQIGIDVNEFPDLPLLAEYCAQNLGRNVLIQTILDNIYGNVKLSESHRILAKFPIHEIWTTNYDDLLEKAFEEIQIPIDVRRRDTDYLSSNPKAKVYINKMHGDINAKEEIIITSSDYESYWNSHNIMATRFLNVAAESTLLFLGIGFTDPNFRHIMSNLKSRFGTAVRTHYAIMLKPSHSNSQFKYFVQNLSKYGIRIVLADTPEDISRILKVILDRCDSNKEYEILIGQDERNRFLVKHFERLAQYQGSTLPKIRMSQVFSAFAISNDPEYAKMEPINDIDNHMAMLMRERNALEYLVSVKGTQLDLLLCPPPYFQAQHEVRYRNILNWLKSHDTLPNLRVRCGKMNYFKNTVIVENDFSILANYNPRSGYDENRVYRDHRRVYDHIETFDRQFENAELSRNIQETIKLYELMLNRFHVEKNAEWELVNSEVKHQWMHLQLRTDIANVRGQGELSYTYVNHPGSVLIVPILPSGKLILVEQYRYLIGTNSIEFPSGALEESDLTKLVCAKRELEEETGYISERWEQLIEFYTTNGLTNEVMTIFIATGIERKHEAQYDSAEIKSVKEFEVSEVQKLISDGTIKDGPTLLAFEYLKQVRLF